MVKSPFYKIVLDSSDTDITDMVTSFRYEHSVEEDNLLEIQITSQSVDLLNKRIIKKGGLITFFFGFLGAEQSRPRKAKIKKITTRYSDTVKITITALDLGYVLKRVTSDEIHSGTASEIFLKIARTFKLFAIIEKTVTVYDALPQGNKSFDAFLKALAVKEGTGDGKSGPVRVFTDGEGINFTRRKLNTPSVRKYEYNNGDGVVIAFTPKDDQDLSGGAVEVSSDFIDTESNVVNNILANNANTQEPALGDKLVNEDIKFDAAGVEIAIKSIKKIFTPADTEERNKNLVGGVKNNKALNELTADIELAGDPTFLSDTVITMAGVADDHLGNWYVSKASHNITGSGYSTTGKLKKNASKTGDTTADDPNKTVGADEGKDSKEIDVIRYDANGNEIPN